MVISSFGEYRILEAKEENFNKLCEKSFELKVDYSSFAPLGKQVGKNQTVKVTSLNENILLIAQRKFSHEIFLLRDEPRLLRTFFHRIIDSKSPEMNLLIIGGAGRFDSDDRRFKMISDMMKIERIASRVISLIALKELQGVSKPHSLVIHKESILVCEKTMDLFSDAYDALNGHTPHMNFPADPSIVHVGVEDELPEEFQSQRPSILAKGQYYIGYLESEEMDDGMLTELSSEDQIVLIARGYNSNGHLTDIGMCDVMNDNSRVEKFFSEMALNAKFDLCIMSKRGLSTSDQATKEVILAISRYRSKIVIKKELSVFDDQLVYINRYGRIFYGEIREGNEEEILPQPNEELNTSVTEL